MLSDKLKALLTLTGKSQGSLAEYKNISKQQQSNKIRCAAYKLNELVELADFTGTQLAFIDEKGDAIIKFDLSDLQKDDKKST